MPEVDVEDVVRRLTAVIADLHLRLAVAEARVAAAEQHVDEDED